jgi:ornithine cyclodeaminase
MSDDSLLLLDNSDIAKLFDLGACLNALEEAYVALARGEAVARPRTQIYSPLDEPDVSYCLKTMEGALHGSGYAVLRLTSDIVSEARVDGVARRTKLARGPGGTYCGLILLFRTDDLAPVAILHDGYMQTYRVACTSALSVRALARADARVLGVLGSAGQAWAHVAATAAVRRLDAVRVYSPDAERRAAFAERVRRELGLAAMPVDSARAAVDGADIVVAATNTSEPVVHGRWLAPGTHVVSIVSGDRRTQRRELDDETMRRAALVVVHNRQAAIDQQQGDLAGPVERGILAWERMVELPELLAGTAAGRARDGDITVFKNNQGTALQFAAVAPLLYAAAKSRDVGRRLDRAWFVETLKP